MSALRSHVRLGKKTPLSQQELHQLDAYWRAANYLTACQLYLLDNPLLERPLVKSDIKQTVVGHWGTCPGQNFIYTHLDRVIKRDDLDMIYLSGPGHGGNAMVAQDWLDGSYTEIYPNITRDKEGMQKLFKRFSFPGGIPSHVAPETPGSIHEGGELGYSLAHAFGAVADNPDLIAACVVGDGEAEEKAKLMAMAEETHVAQHIRWLGFQSGEPLADAYRRASVFVLPTREDCFGLVLLEALCSGTPIVASKYADGAYDTVHPGENGLIVDPEDADALAEAIDSILGSEEIQRRYSQNCRQYIPQFEFGAVMQGYLQAIASVTSGNK